MVLILRLALTLLLFVYVHVFLAAFETTFYAFLLDFSLLLDTSATLLMTVLRIVYGHRNAYLMDSSD